MHSGLLRKATIAVLFCGLSTGLSNAVAEDFCQRSPAVVFGLEIATQKKCEAISPEDLLSVKELSVCGGFGGQTPNTLMEGDFAGLQKLDKLTICQGKIDSIRPEVFSDLPLLKELMMFSLQISELPRGQFKYLTRLNRLVFIQMPLTNVDPDALEGLTNLEILSFDTFPKDSKFEVPKDLLKHVPGLKKLAFGFTANIKVMPPNFLQYTPKIERLWLGWIDLKSSESEILGLKALNIFWYNYIQTSPGFFNELAESHPGIEIKQM